MSLPQLIGMQCVTCGKGIASIIDGTFCDACGNPVHQRCVGAAQQAATDMCPQCGGDAASSIAKEVRRERGTQTQAQQRAQSAGVHGAPVAYPVSKVCPKCGHAEFTRQRPQGWVAFAWDRICTQCGTVYSPPTPMWAAVVFLVAGLLLASFGGISMILALASSNPASAVSGLICPSVLGIMGVLSLIHGIRSLAKPGNS